MKRPDRVKILGQWCHILYVDLKAEGDQADEIFWGDANVDTRIIRIEKTADDEMTKRILRHEKMHMKLGLSGLSELFSAEQEEALCVLAESE